MNPVLTFQILLVVQALHLFHHRIAKRHISFVEVVTGAVLAIPLTTEIPSFLFMSVHLLLATIQVIGSLFIKRLSPEWES